MDKVSRKESEKWPELSVSEWQTGHGRERKQKEAVGDSGGGEGTERQTLGSNPGGLELLPGVWPEGHR